MAKTKAMLPAKIDDMTALQAISSFNEYESKVFKELSDIIRKHNKENLNWYWDLGVRLTGVQEDAKKNKDHYGKNILGRVSAALGFKTVGPLYQALRVVEAFGTKKAFTEYTKLAGEAGNVLTWGHICMLAGVGDPDVRLDLAAAALEKGWPVDTLGEQVAALVNRKQRGIRKAKPKVKIPTSVKKCLQHVTAQAEAFVYAVSSSWTGDAFDLKARVEDIPAGNLNDALLTELQAARKRVAEMVESACTMDDQLKLAEAAIQRKLRAQAAADAAAEEEEEEEEEVEVDEDDDDVGFDDEAEDSVVSLEDLAGDDEEEEEDDDAAITFGPEPVAETEEEDEDNYINIGAEKNAAARAKAAAARARERGARTRRR
jgi:hypothetical protein